MLVGGIAGLGVYCASHAMQVWRARNSAAPAAAAPSGPAKLRRTIRRACTIVITLGLLLLAAGYISSAAVQRRGVLVGHGLFTPRLPQGLEVAELTVRDVVRPGEVVARFCSPTREAEIASLKLRREMLAADRRAALAAPLELDPDVVRRVQDLATERRHLEYSHDQFAPARDLVVREQLRDRLTKQAQVRNLETDLDRLRREQEQAAARLRLRQEQLARAEKVSTTKAAPGQELAERKTELEFQAAEVAKLDTLVKRTEGEVTQLRSDLAVLDRLTGEQAVAFAEQVKRVRDRLASVPAGEAPLKEELAADVDRAKARRAARIEQIELDLARYEAEATGLANSLAVVAPFAGRVAYRDPSPRAASGDAPLLVLAAPDAFRLRLRLTRAEAGALERAGEAVLAATFDGIDFRFPGRLSGRRPLDHDGNHVLAELTCEPPAEAVRELAAGRAVSADLLWSPPLYASPLFPAAASLIVVGAAGWAAAARLLRRAEMTQQEPGPAAPAPPHAAAAGAAWTGDTSASDGADAEFGAAGATLRLLGSQLRTAILRGAVDHSLVAAAEWALDRHHARAVQLLSEALGDDDELIDAAADVVCAGTPVAERLASVLRAVGGEQVRNLLRRPVVHPAPAHAAGNVRRKRDGNGHADGKGHPSLVTMSAE